MKKEYKDFYDLAVREWGEDSQLRMCIEEMSELTKEICKYMRLTASGDSAEIAVKIAAAKEKLKEEIADVMNMSEQLAFVFGEDDVEKIRGEKIKRELNRLEIWKNQKGKNYDA